MIFEIASAARSLASRDPVRQLASLACNERNGLSPEQVTHGPAFFGCEPSLAITSKRNELIPGMKPSSCSNSSSCQQPRVPSSSHAGCRLYPKTNSAQIRATSPLARADWTWHRSLRKLTRPGNASAMDESAAPSQESGSAPPAASTRHLREGT